jgi:Secretion system C-terminal sorting domain
VTVAGRSTPGDVDNNTVVLIGDVTYMADWIFGGGPYPPILNDADVDGDCKANIVDVTYLISAVMGQGPAPLDSDCVPGSLKPTVGGESFVFAENVALDVGAGVNGKRELKYNSTRKVNALAIRLKALNGSRIDVTKTSAKSSLYWSQDGDDVMIGLLDPQGVDFFVPSDSDLVELSGDFEIVSVEATDIHADGTTEYLRPQFVAGKFTAGGAPGISEFSLDGAYPNPFNPVTQIAFSLPVASDVKIEIYNVLGQRVITLTDSYFEAGKHTVRWSSQSESGSTVASGMYFAKMTAGDFSASKKLVILK